ncbi:MAG: hypothetical protein Q9227_006115 [Pyrenula ochraceoflavens]
MPIVCGSIGDIIAICVLAKDLAHTLSTAKGSAASYRAICVELDQLHSALREVVALFTQAEHTPEINALFETTKQAAFACRASVERFQDQIKRYESSFKEGGSASKIGDITKKLQWRIVKEPELMKFRAELCAHSSSINMLIATVTVLVPDEPYIEHDFMLYRRFICNSSERNESRHVELIDRCSDSGHTFGVLNQLRSDMEQHIGSCRANTSAYETITSKVRWLQRVSLDIQHHVRRILSTTTATYRVMLDVQASIQSNLGRSLVQEPCILEDAIGRVAPVHTQFVNSWEAFEAVLELQFKNFDDSGIIQDRQYILLEHTNKQEIIRSRPFEDVFLPGKKILMSVVLENEAIQEPSCPRCEAALRSREESEVQW